VVVAKRLDCPNVGLQDVVIGPWTPREGARDGRIGALAAGVVEDGRLVFVGR
jgi:hypothetical protein